MFQRSSYEPIPSTDETGSVEHSNWWFRSVCLIVVVTCVATIGCCIAAILLDTSTNGDKQYYGNQTKLVNEKQKANQSCSPNSLETEWCPQISVELNKQLNFTVDPCEDFYEYVCGTEHHFGIQYAYTSYQDQVAFITQKTRLALENASYLKSPANHTSKAVNYITTLYHECVNISMREQLGMQPVRALLKQVIGQDSLFDTFELIQNSTQNNRASSFFTKMSDYLRFQKLNYFRKVTPKPNDHPDVQQWMDCYVESWLLGQFGLIHINIDEDSPVAMKTMLKSVQISLTQIYHNQHVDMEFKHFEDLILNYFYVDNFTLLHEAIFEVLDLKANLSNILNVESKSIDSVIPLAALKEISWHEFDWTLLLNKFANRTNSSLYFTDNVYVEIHAGQRHLYRPFTRLIANTPIRVLKNFIAFSILERFERLFEMDRHFCKRHLENLNPIITPIYTRLLIDHVGREKMLTARDRITQMANHIKGSFSASLKSEKGDWIDDKTRQLAQNHLEKMSAMIGFPDWILQDEVVDQKLGFDDVPKGDLSQVIKGQYVASYIKLARLMASAKWRNAILPPNKGDNFIFDYDAHYNSAKNSFVISNVLLFPPTFCAECPDAINYGNLGYVIGHEISHGLDVLGYNLGKQRRPTEWGIYESSERFINMFKCLVEQYDGLLEPITGIKTNGQRTLYDNIADNIGIKNAYHAFQRHLHNLNVSADSQRSLSIGQFTPEQSFFIAFSQSYCGNFQNTTELYSKYDIHSPVKLRVNMPMTNFDQFSHAFNCPVGSKMNPERKCLLW